MNLKKFLVCLSCLIVPQVGSLHAAEPAKQIESKALLYSDNFDGRTELGDKYSTGKAEGTAFTVVDGVLICKQTQDDHGAHMHHSMNFHNADIQFDVRFRGGTSFNVVINDKKDKSVHAGHVSRVSISPKRMTVGDDKTGSMNLEVRALRKQKDLSGEKSKALDELLERTRKSGNVKMNPGQWHHVRVLIDEDVMEAYLDENLVARLQSPGIAVANKTDFGFTINGSTIDFDNLEVRSVE